MAKRATRVLLKLGLESEVKHFFVQEIGQILAREETCAT